ncbi:sigma-70 family RNA polymerase sigma factor [Nocardiopsis potens]|uniref:sigma-70 family RNA polymerase sigma factor n=1 Tax=Nocardiopsis potens TaxID=1246458 RepID=UPI00034B8FA0|nr:sigma-70 family RNA polymerase sigma factor [Nocardiopsis potens]
MIDTTGNTDVRTPAADAVRDHFAKIGRTPLLTAEQEVELGARIEAGAQARERLDAEGGRLAPAERDALERLAADGLRAREHMIEANLRLVVSIAKRYAGGGLPLPDLIQEGTIGMMRAVEKFDHRRGLKFSTYATWWIKQAIGRALTDRGRTVRIPSHMATVVNRVARARRAMRERLGRTPSSAELAAELDLPAPKVELALRCTREPVSLNTPVGEDGDGSELGDLVPDEAADPAAEATAAAVRPALDKVLATLSEREAAVISQRFGLDGDRPRTLNEIGARFGLTRERIRQIEVQGMQKLRRPSRTRALADLLS